MGFGVEGRSAFAYWRSAGAEITICDANPKLKVPGGAQTRLGPEYLTGLESFDLIVRSPGVRPPEIMAANPNLQPEKITSVTREFLAKCPSPVIGVTGTKGKGTTATLIAKILEAAGRKVWLGGNIGRPALDFLADVKPTDYAVLELSSFQLIDATQSPQTGVILMIAPDHQNWHADMREYVAAKGNLVRFQAANHMVVYNAQNRFSSDLAQLSQGRKVPYAVGQSTAGNRQDEAGAYIKGGQIWMDKIPICSTGEVRLLGRHNLENVCAAVAATWPVVQDPAPIKRAIAAFTGLPHRLESVGEVGGVRYIDDSFSVVPDAAMAAIRSFAEPKVVVLGGSDKGAEFEALARTVKDSNVKACLVIGEVAPKIAAALDAAGFSDYVTGLSDMPGVLRAAAVAAAPGDVVLLSPGCASFGLFRDYKDRGERFKAAVSALAGEQ